MKETIIHIPEPDRTIGKMLIEFYETMKELEKDEQHGQGKQAVKIIMTINDFKELGC